MLYIVAMYVCKAERVRNVLVGLAMLYIVAMYVCKAERVRR